MKNARRKHGHESDNPDEQVCRRSDYVVGLESLRGCDGHHHHTDGGVAHVVEDADVAEDVEHHRVGEDNEIEENEGVCRIFLRRFILTPKQERRSLCREGDGRGEHEDGLRGDHEAEDETHVAGANEAVAKDEEVPDESNGRLEKLVVKEEGGKDHVDPGAEVGVVAEAVEGVEEGDESGDAVQDDEAVDGSVTDGIPEAQWEIGYV